MRLSARVSLVALAAALGAACGGGGGASGYSPGPPLFGVSSITATSARLAAAGGAGQYHFELDDAPDFAPPFVREYWVADDGICCPFGARVDASLLEPNTNYWARCFGPGGASNVVMFTTLGPPAAFVASSIRFGMAVPGPDDVVDDFLTEFAFDRGLGVVLPVGRTRVVSDVSLSPLATARYVDPSLPLDSEVERVVDLAAADSRVGARWVFLLVAGSGTAADRMAAALSSSATSRGLRDVDVVSVDGSGAGWFAAVDGEGPDIPGTCGRVRLDERGTRCVVSIAAGSAEKTLEFEVRSEDGHWTSTASIPILPR